ncbi:MAG: sensor histidine kinase [Verrucomicrobia bacterium]|nr:sensor histidine kinase [Verrucomicrobiota bacterium]
MKRKSSGLSRRYQAALCHYLGQGPSASLEPAAGVGRQAVALGLETLDLALIHEQALLTRVLPGCPATGRNRLVKRAGTFFAEAILPLEETHRAALEANVRLSRANRTLNQRTVELATSNRELKKEIAQRQAVEETLRQSEQHSTRLLEQSRRLQEQLRQLSRQILSAQEEERKRISRELHDVIAQVLTGINVQLATLKTEATVSTKGLTRNISRTQRLVEKSVDIVHRFARELRPALLDDLGLIPALHSYLKEFAKRTGLRASLMAFTSGRIEELDSAGRTALYRVAQEALNNVARHAQASRVEASILKVAHGLRLQIKDDGKSFEVEQVLHAKKNQRLGLLGMRERVEMVGGQFTVESAPGQGTTIQAQIPLGNGLRGGGGGKLTHEASPRSTI